MISSRSRLSYKDRRSHQKQRYRFVGVVLLALAIYGIVSVVLAEPWILETDAMGPTMPSGTRFLVSPYLIRSASGSLRRPPDRGDIVSLHPPYAEQRAWHIRIFDPFVRFITLQNASLGIRSDSSWDRDRVFKRVIGIPGDTIRMSGSVAYVRGRDEEFFLSEFEMSGSGYDLQVPELPPGWTSDLPLAGERPDFTLGTGEYFVLGDNRSASNDSRYWGPVDESLIRGRVILIYWPFRSFGSPR